MEEPTKEEEKIEGVVVERGDNWFQKEEKKIPKVFKKSGEKFQIEMLSSQKLSQNKKDHQLNKCLNTPKEIYCSTCRSIIGIAFIC